MGTGVLPRRCHQENQMRTYWPSWRKSFLTLKWEHQQVLLALPERRHEWSRIALSNQSVTRNKWTICKQTASLQPTSLKFTHMTPRHLCRHASHLQELPQQWLLRVKCVLSAGAWQLGVQLRSAWRSRQITHMLFYANAHLKTFQSPHPFRHRIIPFSQMYCV